MGWVVGAGLSLFFLVIVSSVALVISLRRLYRSSPEGRPLFNVLPAWAGAAGFCVFVFLRYFSVPRVAFEIVLLVTIVLVIAACVPRFPAKSE